MTVQETRRETETADGVSRRGFLAGSGLVFGLAVTGSSVTLFDAKAATGFQPSIWMTLGTDGRMQILAPAGEMGQGVLTAMPMLFAEEFDADWGLVDPVLAEFNPKLGNPMFGGFMLTGASRTTRGYWKKLRIAGAQARRIMLDAAAKKWGVPVGELTTRPSTVVHAKSGKTLSYGEIAKFASIPSKMPKITEKDLKPRSEWRIIGNPDIVRVDVPWKVNGSAKYGIDQFVPGMLYASVLRAPAAGNSPKKVDKAAAMKVKGVVAVVPLPYGVAVVGTNIWATKAGKAELKVTWTDKAPSSKYSTDSIRKAYTAAAKDPKAKAAVALNRGDVAGAMKKASKTMTAEYWADHVYHATMEPMNCIAWVKDGGEVEVWAPTQAPSINVLVASKVAGTKPNKVKVHQTLMGGGYGRRFEQDFLVDALILSKVTKKPVKVIWSREDDVQHDEYRPCVAQRLQASLDKDGKIIGWTHRVVAESVFARSMPQALKAAKGVDDSVVDGQQLMYEIPSQIHDYVREERGVPVGFWRAVGPGYTKFAIETFIDEIAKSLGKDPVEYRLSMLKDPRSINVIKTAAHMAQWNRKRTNGRALGIAYAGYPTFWRSHIAEVAEVSVDRSSGKIKVHNVWAAVDPGVAVSPRNVRAQVEGAIVMGISSSLIERITIEKGVTQQSNFDSYPVLRMDEVPAIHVNVMPAGDVAPGGMGEVGLPPVGAAIANAVFALTGAKLREQPMLPDRVLKAMKA